MPDQPVQRRLVGAALRRYRERLGFRLADAAGVLECNTSKISRIETGERGIRPLELRILLNVYAVDEEEQQTLLAAASAHHLARGWWRDYIDVLPASAQDYLFLERIACGILRYDAQQVPDIVQTPGYAHALADITVGQHGPEARHRLADMQAARQQAITHAEDPPAISVVIGEGALRQDAGDAAVLRGQVQYLLEVSDVCPRVSVQVLPLSSFAHATVRSGTLEILRFAGSPDLGVVRYAPAAGIETCHVSEQDIAAAVNAFILIKKAALGPQASAQMLRTLIA